MDEPSPIFTLPFGDAESNELRNKSTEYVEVFHQSLPSGNLLENDEAIQQFLSSNDPLEEPDLNGPTTLHCEICKKKFGNAKKYYGHLRIHSNKEEAWVCDKCPNGRFTTKQQLLKHSLTHKPLERIWKCPQCPMVFEVLFRLQQHLFAKHLNCRPHKCGLCEKAFNKLSDLKKHEAVHSLKRKFPCEVCHQRFKDRSNLQRHQLTHSKEKPFACVGCNNRYSQIASLRRHTKSCEAVKEKKVTPMLPSGPSRVNYCRVCGMTFQYKGQLLEHYDKAHSNTSEAQAEASAEASPPEISIEETSHDQTDFVSNVEQLITIEDISNVQLDMNDEDSQDDVFLATEDQSNVDSTVVDTIVEDILSVEDEYRIVNSKPMQNRNEIVKAIKREAYKKETALKQEKNARLQQEFLKEMNQFNNLEDELFYNDLDFDALHPNQIFSTANDIVDLNTQEQNGEILFDFNDASRSIDQDIINALCEEKNDNLTDELLLPADTPVDVAEDLLGSHVSINECSTIFETDVDLEASTNLAANLNQLIGENNVRYVSTEHDDTFIISLDSGIDADKLSDMLNIGGDLEENMITETSKLEPVVETSVDKSAADAIVFKIPETKVVKETESSGESQNKENKEIITKSRKEMLFVCRMCEKVFNRRENYWSHMAVHDASLRRHECNVCARRFSYRSTLSKHTRAAHEPRVAPSHECPMCGKPYRAQWMLKHHMERDHSRLTPYECQESGCTKKFYKKSDLVVHMRFHTGERPYACDVCKKRFQHSSHLMRHKRSPNCAKSVYNPRLVAVKPTKPPPPVIKRDKTQNEPKKTETQKEPPEPLIKQSENIFNPRLVAFKPSKQPPPLIKRDQPKFSPKKNNPNNNKVSKVEKTTEAQPSNVSKSNPNPAGFKTNPVKEVIKQIKVPADPIGVTEVLDGNDKMYYVFLVD